MKSLSGSGLDWPGRLKRFTRRTALAGSVLTAAWFSQGTAQAQTIFNNYDFAASAGTFTPLGTTATQMPLVQADTYISPSTPIGFTFNFDGVNYTDFRASSNGFLSFNSSASANTVNNLATISASSRPLVAPLWDDLDGKATGGSNASYEVTGTAGSRIFTFEWLNWEFNWLSNDPVISFQVKLYEADGKIEYIYRPESGSVNNGSASIGLAGVGTGAGNFLSLSDLSAAPTASYTNETNNINTKPVAGQTYTFTRVVPSALDVMASSLVAPVAAPGCFPANQTVTVAIKNNGTALLDFATNPVTVNASATIGTTTTNFPAVIVNTGTLAPGATQNVTVATNYQMTLAGDYAFNATATVVGDGRTSNDAMAETTVTLDQRQVPVTTSLPQTVDFTGFTGSNLATVFPGWGEASTVNATGTTSNWTSDDFGNVSGGSNGKAARINLDAASDDVWILSPKFTANASTAFKFKLALTGFGNTNPATMGSDDQLQVMVSTDCGQTYTAIQTYSANTPISNTGQNESISLAAYAGQDIIVGLYATEGSTNDPEDNDLFVDDLFIGTPPAIDMSATALVSPVAGGCFTAPEPVIVAIQNLGANPVNFATTPTTVTVNVTGAATQTLTFVVNTGSLAPNASMNVTVGNLTMSAAGTYTFNGATSIAGDTITANNSFAAVSIQNATIATFPTVQDFEGFTPIGSTADGHEGWSVETSTSLIWEIEEGTSGSTGTGPAVDHTLGTTAGNYVFLETSSGNLNEEAGLISPCINLSGQTGIGMEFWYHMFGATVDTLSIDIHNGTAWVNNVLVIGGQHQNATTDPWLKAIINLNPYNGSVIKVRFRAKRGSSFTGDIAVDDVRFFQLPPVELTASSLTLPNSNCGLSATETICMTIINNGGSTVSNFPVSYTINGGTAVTETVSTPIASGASIQYCFTTKANLTAAGTYTIAGLVSAAGDADTTNNAVTGTVMTIPTIATFPYFQDFENGNGGWRTNTTGSSWALGAPTGTVISSAASGTNAWVTNLSGDYPNNEQSAVVGPCFNFTNIPNPSISMKIWWDLEEDWDGTILQSSIDGGATWQTVGAFGDPNNWYNADSIDANPGNQPISLNGNFIGWSGTGSTGSGGWVTASHALTGLGGQASVQLRIAFGSDAAVTEEGFAFDDVTISNFVAVPTVTAGGPTTFCQGDSVILTAATTTTGATFTWELNGTAIAGATSNMLTVTTSGSYTVVANANGTATSAPTVVTVNALPAMPTITAGGATTFCAGDSVVLTGASTTTGVTYQWLLNGTAITNATSATYTANATGNYMLVASNASGCTDTSLVTAVSVTPLPATPTIAQSGPSGQTLTSSSATGNQWYLDGNAIVGATGETYNTTANGNYTVVVTDTACSSNPSAPVTITNTGMSKALAGMSVNVYPNPNKGNFNVKLTGYKQAAALELYSLTGQLIVKEKVKAGQEVTPIQVKNLAAGTYLLKVVSEKGMQISKLIVE